MALPAHPGRKPLIQFCNHFTDGRTPWTSDQPDAKPLPKHRTTETQTKRIHTSNIHALSGIRTYDSNVRESEDSSCLRLRACCVRLTDTIYACNTLYYEECTVNWRTGICPYAFAHETKFCDVHGMNIWHLLVEIWGLAFYWLYHYSNDNLRSYHWARGLWLIKIYL
jgi:hypothetical protein